MLRDYYAARAESAEKQQQWTDAADALKRYILFATDDIQARIRLAEAADRSATTPEQKYRATGYYYHALGLADDALNQETEVRLVRRLATLLAELGGFPPAKVQAERLLAIDDKDPVALEVLAKAAYADWLAEGSAIGDLPQVIDAIHRALDVSPGNIELAEQLAGLYRERLASASSELRARLADGVMDRLVQANPHSVAALLARHRYRQRYGLPGSDTDLDAALKLDPNDAEAVLAAGIQALQQDQLDQAHSYLLQARNLAAKDPRVYLFLGDVLARQQKLPQAIQTWQEGLLYAGPYDVDLNARIADKLIDLKKWDQAEDALKRLSRVARSLTPNVSRLHRTKVRGIESLMRAKLALAKGQTLKGIEELKVTITAQHVGAETSVELDEHYQSRIQFGRVYLALGQWDLAVRQFEEAIALAPDRPDARLALADAWRAGRQLDQALQQYKYVLLQDSANHEAQLGQLECQFEMQLQLNAPSMEMDQLSQALADARQANPDRIGLQLIEAMYAQRQGRLEEAIRLLEEAVAKNPSSLSLARSLALAYQQNGNPTAADKLLSQLERIESVAADELLLARADLVEARGQRPDAKKLLHDALPALAPYERLAIVRRLVDLGLEPDELSELRQWLARQVQASPIADFRTTEWLAELALLAEDYNDLARWETQLKQLAGDQGSTWRYYRARRLLAESDDVTSSQMIQAIQLQAELEGMRPLWAPTHVLKGLAAQRQGKLEDAASAFRRAIELGENRISTYGRLIALLYRQNRFVEADRYATTLGQFLASSQELSVIALSTATKRGQVERAVQLALEGVKHRPEDPMAHVWLAVAQTLAGRNEEAEATYHVAIRLAPEDARTWTALASFYKQTGRPQLARQQIEKLAQNVRLSEADRLNVIAQGYEVIGAQAEARDRYMEAAERFRQHVPIQRHAAMFFMAAEPRQAEVCWRRVLDVASEDEQARRQLALLLVARGGEDNLLQARQLLDKVKTPIASLSAQRLEALLLVRQGSASGRTKAIQLLEHVLQQSESPFSDDRLILASLYEQEGRTHAADQQLLTLCSRARPKPEHVVAYVDFLLRYDRSKDARLWLDRLIELEPDSMRTLRLRCRLLASLNQRDQADALIAWSSERGAGSEEQGAGSTQIDSTLHAPRSSLPALVQISAESGLPATTERLYRQLVMLDPGSYRSFAVWLAKEGRAEDAVKMCLEAHAKSGDVQPIVALCSVLAQSPSLETSDAEAAIAKALLEHGNNEQLLFYAALVRHAQARVAEALHLYRQTLAVNAQHVMAMNNLGLLLADEPDSLDESQRLIQRAIDLHGATPQLLDSQALVWIRAGRAAEAIQQLTDLVSTAQPDPSHLFHLAAAQLTAGQLDQARQTYQQALNRGFSDSNLTRGEQQFLEAIQKATAPASRAD